MEPDRIYVHNASKIKKYGSMLEVRSEYTGNTTEYIIVETKKILHNYVVNADVADFCKQCGLYFTGPIHIRG